MCSFPLSFSSAYLFIYCDYYFAFLSLFSFSDSKYCGVQRWIAIFSYILFYIVDHLVCWVCVCLLFVYFCRFFFCFFINSVVYRGEFPCVSLYADSVFFGFQFSKYIFINISSELF